MYKEEVRTREWLNSAMDALDRLGKKYKVEKVITVKKLDEVTAAFTGKTERTEESWVIEEM